MILSCQHITKSFIENKVLSDVNMTVNENDRIAIVGINGAGKSTLFKILSGETAPDGGQLVTPKKITIGYLKQEAMTDTSLPIYDALLASAPEILSMEERMHELESRIHDAGVSEEDLIALNHSYASLRHAYEQKDGYSLRSRCKGILIGLGFSEDEFTRPADVLSGGQKTRLALGQLLLQQPDLLLLDEPTNHLDMKAILWLESYLSNYRSALMIISHDRYFIDKVANRIVEIEHGRTTDYYGNYSFYTEHKQLRREIEEKHYANQQKDIKHQEEVIRKLRSFNREKSIKRAESREKALNKIDRMDKPLTLHDTMHFQLTPHVESGQDVLAVDGLEKSFGTLKLFNALEMDIKKGERIGLLGENGTGKSTLLKILTGNMTADNGDIRFGSKVQVGYYDQEHGMLESHKTLFDEISDTYPALTQTEIRNSLAAFLFTGDDVYKTIDTLSGGERGRLTLAKLILSESNFLILDEPTNHLDIISKSILESALRHYAGTILFVSHDRYFVNQVATRIVELENGAAVSYYGNYDDFMEKKADRNAAPSGISLQSRSDSANGASTANKKDWLKEKENKARKQKMERQLAQAEDSILELEEEIENIDEKLSLEEVYTDHEKTMALTDKKGKLQAALEDAYALWTEAQEALE